MDDPLIYKGRIKAGWLNAFRVGVNDVNKKMKKVNWPFLCVQAGNDPWIPATEIQRIMELAASPDKKIVVSFITQVSSRLAIIQVNAVNNKQILFVEPTLKDQTTAHGFLLHLTRHKFSDTVRYLLADSS